MTIAFVKMTPPDAPLEMWGGYSKRASYIVTHEHGVFFASTKPLMHGPTPTTQYFGEFSAFDDAVDACTAHSNGRMAA